MSKIKEKFGNLDNFSFKPASYENVSKGIMSLDVSKACPKTTIPPKIIKDSCDLFSIKLQADFKFSIENACFPTNLKFADISPTHKKGDRTDKTNYRPVSIPPAISKIFERLLVYQIYNFMDSKLSIQQCGFRKGYSAQHCLVVIA